MTKLRIWTIGAVGAMIAIVALGWFLGIDPKLAEARAADDDRSSVAAVNLTHEVTLAELKKLQKNLSGLESDLADLDAALPPDAEISSLLGELNGLATASGVDLEGILAGKPVNFEADPIAAAAKADAAKAAAAPAEGDATTTDSASQTAAVPGMKNLVSVPVSVTVTGSNESLADFVKRVQFGTRLFLVTDLDLNYTPDGGKATLEGLIYVLLDSAS